VRAARIAVSGKPLALDLSVTTGMLDRLKGWMGRKSIAERDALFIEPCNSVHTWFMHVPIDVVFVDRKRRIVSVRDNVVPRRLCAHWRAAAVLELQAGRREALGLAPGVQLDIEDGEGR
jgi:uncharacterized protein